MLHALSISSFLDLVTLLSGKKSKNYHLTRSIHIFFLNFINSAEVAKHLNEDSCGLIFGVNTFIALVLQSLLTVIVVNEGVLGLTTRTQVSSISCVKTLFLKSQS
jgi:thiamine transporter 2/3